MKKAYLLESLTNNLAFIQSSVVLLSLGTEGTACFIWFQITVQAGKDVLPIIYCRQNENIFPAVYDIWGSGDDSVAIKDLNSNGTFRSVLR